MDRTIAAFIQSNISKVAKKVEKQFNLRTVYSVYDSTVYIQLKHTILDVYEADIEPLIKNTGNLEEHQMVNLIADNVIEFFIKEMNKVKNQDIFLEDIKISLGKI